VKTLAGIRRERLQEQMVRELSDIIQNRLKDPRKGWLSVTRVELSADLRHARVYVSVLGGEEEKRQGMDLLERAKSFIRNELAGRLHVRHVPELRFRLDESIEASQRVLEILKNLEIPPEEGGETEA
jgi:ribosome-binding factor A